MIIREEKLEKINFPETFDPAGGRQIIIPSKSLTEFWQPKIAEATFE